MKGNILIECIVYIGITALISAALISSTMQIGKGMWSIIYRIEASL